MKFSIFSFQFSKLTLPFILGTFFVLPIAASAAGLVPCGGEGESPCTLCHFFLLFKNIVDFLLFRLVPPLAILMIVWGGAMFLMATGDPSQLARAKGIITSTMLGLVIIYSAWLFVGLFFSSISASVGFAGPFSGMPSTWFRINCSVAP